MNPTLVKIGIALIAAGLTYVIVKVTSYNRNVPQPHQGSYGNYDGSNSNTCYICIQDFDGLEPIVKLPCQHKYHRECFGLLLKEGSHQRICSVCRQEFSDSFIHSQGFFLE